jgi:O-antigen biosynthesis protein
VAFGKHRRKRLLLVAPALPMWDRLSGDRRLTEILKALATMLDVELLVLGRRPPDAARYEADLRAAGVRRVSYGMWRCLSGMVLQAWDAVFFEFYFSAAQWLEPFRLLHPAAAVVVDSVDLHFLREASALQVGAAKDGGLEQRRSHELDIYRAADIVIAITESERDVLAMQGVPEPMVIPNIVPILARASGSRGPIAIFVGGFRHAPNLDAVRWLHQTVWPRVREEFPTASCLIVGSDPPEEVARLDGTDGFVVTGFVESTTPYLEKARVALAPLRYGAGMKGKVSEALGARVPVVTTTFGSQGFDLGRGTAFIEADEPEAFANGVCLLFRDDAACERIGEAGQRLAQDLCSIDAVRWQLEQLVEQIPESAPTSLPVRMGRIARFLLRRKLARNRLHP